MAGVEFTMGARQVLWVSADYATAAAVPPPGPAWSVHWHTPKEALDALKIKDFQAIILDFPIPGPDPEQLLERLQRLGRHLPILIHGPTATVADAVRLAKAGVQDVLTGGFRTRWIHARQRHDPGGAS